MGIESLCAKTICRAQNKRRLSLLAGGVMTIIRAAIATLLLVAISPSHAVECMDNNGRYCSQPSPRVVPHARARRHKLSRVPSASRRAVFDGNGNLAGAVVSHKTGARARVSPRHAAAFQAYIDDLEAHGARVLFMGGYRHGRCSSAHQHPCGAALDVCQLSRGRVDARCHLPGRRSIADIAAAHGLFEGGRWCHSDYGHAQALTSAGDCSRTFAARRARRL